jgi:eukaryotic-like serine/threonine-protein kinase
MTTSDKTLVDRLRSGDEAELSQSSDGAISDGWLRPARREDPVLGRRLGGRYRVERRIGEGGMGAVYEVVDPTGGRFAAKVVSLEALCVTAAGKAPARSRDELTRTLRRFVREAETAKEVRSEHVVRAIELGIDGDLGLPFIVMELLQGVDLGALIRERAPLPPHVVAQIGIQAAKGLARAHALGVVHRDVKPSNVFLHVEAESVVVKVCDFGIAKQVVGDGEQTSNELTGTGGVLGSPRYMSPEQVTNARSADAASDVWSLCASLYEALSGRALWQGRSSLGELIVAICTEPVPLLSVDAPWVPRELALVVQRGLERTRSRRYRDMHELISALEPHAAPAPLRPGQLARHEARSERAPAESSLDVVSELDALDPGFQTQGVARRPVAASVPAPPAAAESRRLRAIAVAVVLAGAVVAAVALGLRSGRSTHLSETRPPASALPAAPIVTPIASAHLRAKVQAAPSRETGGAPAAAPSAVARPVAAARPRSVASVSPAVPAKNQKPPETKNAAVAPSEPPPAPTVLAPKEQW